VLAARVREQGLHSHLQRGDVTHREDGHLPQLDFLQENLRNGAERVLETALTQWKKFGCVPILFL
jgi:hypothetical protein